MEPVNRLILQNVAYSYSDGTKAVGGVDLAIAKGEFIGILGYNGSGKTTLLKIMDGMIKDFTGRVLLDGMDIRGLSPREIYSRMGIVFQNPNDQLFAPTVFEDVAFGPLNMGFSEKEIAIRVQKALESVNMAAFGRKPISHLSFGEKKRICIAGLLSMGHEILLLDEPTAGLDPLGEYAMMDLLTGLNKNNGVTIAMATHSIDLVPVFLDRLCILNNGRIARSGPPETIFTAPEEMASVRLRLPQIADLIFRLKHEDHLPFDRIPLTIGEARREILEVMKFGHSGTDFKSVPEK
ncbi:MAG: ATP-binding cassette domain-containing protein [Syntrophales bacterium]|nr:ATP-binding cassette domain-containing protein [Syntrophales bacterium]